MDWPNSPFSIKLMLHCYACPEPVKNADLPLVQEQLKAFQSEGLIAATDGSGRFEATPKGRAWVAAICSTPIPKQAWIDSAGKILDDR